MQLTKYAPVLNGLSFVLDTQTPGNNLAYLLQTSGSSAVVTLQGTGVWSVDVLGSADGVNFTLLATRTMPGTWRFDTTGLSALAVRVATFTSGGLTGVLSHGGAVLATNVLPLFGAFLLYNYVAATAPPPIGQEIRFNAVGMPQVTRVWATYMTTDGTDQFQALRKIPHGGTLLVQERPQHLNAVLFRVTAPPVDMITYIEIPVSYLSNTGTVPVGQVLIAVFNAGPTILLNPATTEVLPALPAPYEQEIEPPPTAQTPTTPLAEPCDG